MTIRRPCPRKLGTAQEAGAASQAEKSTMRVYIGTYTSRHEGDAAGIYVADYDPQTGTIHSLRDAAVAENPSFLALDANDARLYSVAELGDGAGAVAAWSIDQDSGVLTAISKQPTRGSAPCHLVVDAAGRHVLAACYGSGTVCVMPIRDDGGVGELTQVVAHEGASVNPERQEAAHAHSVNLDPDGRFVFVCDLGMDRTVVYGYDSMTGRLEANSEFVAHPGAGPRHFAMHPNGRFAYVINELDSTVTACVYEGETGVLSETGTVTSLPEDFNGENTCADLHVSPDGRFVYGSNRGHDSIAVFEVDPGTGAIAAQGHQSTGGATPRNFALAPEGRYLFAANQDSHSIVGFECDPESGALTPTDQVIDVPSPGCIKFTRT